MNTLFDGFKKCISHQLEGIQTPNLEGAQDELTALWKGVEDLKDRLVLSIPIIEVTQDKKKLQDIGVLEI